jgi:hypothetical protein
MKTIKLTREEMIVKLASIGNQCLSEPERRALAEYTLLPANTQRVTDLINTYTKGGFTDQDAADMLRRLLHDAKTMGSA